MRYLIGIDEAGRGPWAGPIVVGGFMVLEDVLELAFTKLHGLTDSKRLSSTYREAIFSTIEYMQSIGECQYGFSYRDADIIDAIGIREANRQCMQDVILSFLSCLSEDDTVEIYIDGCDNYRFESIEAEYRFAKKMRKKEKANSFCHLVGVPFSGIYKEEIISYSGDDLERDLPHSCIAPMSSDARIWEDNSLQSHTSATLGMTNKITISYVIGGDVSMPAISASSIVAKVLRDRMMCDFSVEFPGYGFDQHKGYGTLLHREKLATLGVSSIHRASYAPVKRLIFRDASI